eukprot:2724744-Rhodomonas_salina.4
MPDPELPGGSAGARGVRCEGLTAREDQADHLTLDQADHLAREDHLTRCIMTASPCMPQKPPSAGHTALQP